MKTHLTDEQIAFYRENGFVVLHDLFGADELDAWRKAVDEAVLGRGNVRILGHEGATAGEAYYDNVFVQRVNLWQDNPAIKDLVLDPRIGKLACELEGTDGCRVWHDQALIKAPWANQTSFHLDNPYWSFSSRHATTIWVALDDVTIQNGCLYFLPGSHKLATWDNSGIGPNMRDLFKVYPDWARIEPAPVEMKAGSATFHNGLTAHAAGPNMTPRYRRAMTCAYYPEGSTFNGKQNILTEEQMATLKVGDVLEDDERNPVVYSRASAMA